MKKNSLKKPSWKSVRTWYRQRKEKLRIKREESIEKQKNSKLAKVLQPIYKWMNRLSLVFHLLLACMINLAVEAISRHSLLQAWEYMLGSPKVFLYNAAMIFTTFSIVYLVRRRVFARILVSVFWVFLGACNGYMLIKRVTPFNAQDLKVFTDALTMLHSYFKPNEMVFVVIGVLVVLLWVVSMWRRGGQYKGKLNRLVSAVGVGVTVLFFFFLTNYAIEKRIVSSYFGNIAFAYEDYGFPYCFSASIFNTGISEPNAYTKQTIQSINPGNVLGRVESETDVKPNIIFIQLESFFDPYEVEFLEMSEDPIPTFRKIMEEHSTGYFKVPSIGAGTANTEFEVLTGMNLRFFGPGEYPYKSILKYKTCESLATALSEIGYGAHALHNNGGNFYSRAIVFDHIGFDTFVSKEFMNILQETPNGWAKDNILTEHIMNALNSTPQQDFVFGITVQGHGEYPEEKVIINPQITVSGAATQKKNNSWEYFVNQLYETDLFIKDLLEEIEKKGEPTVLVLYGDHLPTMNLQSEDLKNRYLYNTNYVIWDNIGLEKQDKNLASYQIGAELFDRLGLKSGTIFNYHQTRRQTTDYLADLELLQYDILYGNQYVYNGKVPIEEGNMVMGVNEQTVKNIIAYLDGTYGVLGAYFTRHSKIYVNGERQSTVFFNDIRLGLRDCKLEDGDIITVSQVGSSDTIFRVSKEYIYEEAKPEEVEIEDVEEGSEADAKDDTELDVQADAEGGIEEPESEEE